MLPRSSIPAPDILLEERVEGLARDGRVEVREELAVGLPELVLRGEAVLAREWDDQVLQGGVAGLVVAQADGGLDL